MSDNLTSSFVEPDDVRAEQKFSDFQQLESRGFNTLTVAQRYGRRWLLKGLRVDVRESGVYRAMLRKEFDILIGLQHSGVAAAFSLEDVEELGPCIVMEYIDGQTLRAWLQTGPSKARRRRVAEQLMDALAYVHGRQVVHRDLKPENVMITRSGENVKLIDFGLSDADDYAVLKQPAGTEGYAAPETQEQWQTDVRADIYSLGCILSELRLGPLQRGVVSRCLAPASRRFGTVDAVARAYRRQRKLPAAAGAVAVVLALAAALLFLAKSNSRLSEGADSLQANVAGMRAAANAEREAARRTNDSLQGRLNELEGERAAGEAHKQEVEAAFAAVKRQYDAVARAYQHHIDTLTAGRYFNKFPADSLWHTYNKAIDALPPSITANERAQILTRIEQVHLSKNERWIKRYGELPW